MMQYSASDKAIYCGETQPNHFQRYCSLPFTLNSLHWKGTLVYVLNCIFIYILHCFIFSNDSPQSWTSYTEFFMAFCTSTVKSVFVWSRIFLLCVDFVAMYILSSLYDGFVPVIKEFVAKNCPI